MIVACGFGPLGIIITTIINLAIAFHCQHINETTLANGGIGDYYPDNWLTFWAAEAMIIIFSLIIIIISLCSSYNEKVDFQERNANLKNILETRNLTHSIRIEVNLDDLNTKEVE